MAWLSLRLAADGNQAEAWADALLDAGALSVSIEDSDAGTAREQAQFGEPGMDDPRAWSHNWVVALLSGEADVKAMLAAAGIPLDVAHSVEAVPEQDWVRATQSQFDPIRIADGLWIVPSWHAPPDPAALCIQLDPGLAFGTGSHPTTRLCLRWLHARIQGGESVLDYGCGSGILAIAAAKCGARPVLGVDIDPQAVSAARDNAARNDVAADFGLPDSLPDPYQADILVANILTNPLKALAPLLADRVKSGGRLALSGILESQAAEILDRYGPAFDMSVWAVEEGWCLLTGTRRSVPSSVLA
jgi:ribosomal protein L11 methyltransferase